MRIDITDTPPEQGLPLDKVQDLLVRCQGCLRQVAQLVQDNLAAREIAECDLSGHEGMPEDLAGVEQRGELLVRKPIDTDMSPGPAQMAPMPLA